MSAPDRNAAERGHCIHGIRMTLAERARTEIKRHADRVRWRLSVRVEVAHLRAMGPGPVVIPTTLGGPIGEPIEWWGCDTCTGDGRRSFNDDGADVEGFCSWCPKGTAAERRYLRRQGLGGYAKHSTLCAPFRGVS